MNVNLILTNEKLYPELGSVGASGYDLRADLETPFRLRVGWRTLISTGIRLQMSPGFEAQIRPRSGLAHKHGITVLNAPGTVDSDYTGDVGVILLNLGYEDYTIQPGERIAQMVFAPVVHPHFEVVESFDYVTTRGSEGFGSTGKL